MFNHPIDKHELIDKKFTEFLYEYIQKGYVYSSRNWRSNGISIRKGSHCVLFVCDERKDTIEFLTYKGNFGDVMERERYLFSCDTWYKTDYSDICFRSEQEAKEANKLHETRVRRRCDSEWYNLCYEIRRNNISAKRKEILLKAARSRCKSVADIYGYDRVYDGSFRVEVVDKKGRYSHFFLNRKESKLYE